MKFFVLLGTLVLSTLAFATPDMPRLKETVIKKFLLEANNPKTKLAKRIDHINAETSDGRNPEGSIEIPVTVQQLQIVTVSAEELYNPWHYAYKSEDELTCHADGDSATFLLLLSAHTGVRSASEYQTYSFIVSAFESQSAVRKDGKKIEFCDDVMFDENDEYIISGPDYTANEFQEIEIKDPTSGGLK